MSKFSANSLPRWLLIDGSGRDVDCGLLSSGQIDLAPTPETRSVSSLIPAIKQLLNDSPATKEVAENSILPSPVSKSLGLIATTYGPGAFTSLRIGITAAKSLGYCFQVPVVGVSSLDSFALAALFQWQTNQSFRQQLERSGGVTICSSLNAFGKKVFVKKYQLEIAKFQSLELQTLNFEEWISCEVSKIAQQIASEKQNGVAASACNQNVAPDSDPKSVGWGVLQGELESISYSSAHAIALEAKVGSTFFTSTETVSLVDQADWIRFVTKSINEPQFWFTSPETWKKSVLKSVSTSGGSAEHLADRWLVPESDTVFKAIAALAAVGWHFLSAPQRSPMALQPVYFRKSAAEENAAKL